MLAWRFSGQPITEVWLILELNCALFISELLIFFRQSPSSENSHRIFDIFIN